MLMIVLTRRSCRISPLLVTSLSILSYKSSKEITFRLIIVCCIYTYQSALRRAFAWKTGNKIHFAVSRNSALRVRHNNDVIYYI